MSRTLVRWSLIVGWGLAYFWLASTQLRRMSNWTGVSIPPASNWLGPEIEWSLRGWVLGFSTVVLFFLLGRRARRGDLSHASEQFLLGNLIFILGMRVLLFFVSPLVAGMFCHIVLVALLLFECSFLLKASPRPWRGSAIWLLGCFALIAIFLVLRIEFCAAHVAGDAYEGEWEQVSQLLTTPRPYWIAEHYDESMWLFFWRGCGLQTLATSLLPYWILTSCFLAAVFDVTVRTFYRAGADWKQSLAITACLFFVGFYFIPGGNLYLFDSSNPIAYTLHPSRIWTSVSLLWAVFVAAPLFFESRFVYGLAVSAYQPGLLFTLGLGAGLRRFDLARSEWPHLQTFAAMFGWCGYLVLLATAERLGFSNVTRSYLYALGLGVFMFEIVRYSKPQFCRWVGDESFFLGIFVGLLTLGNLICARFFSASGFLNFSARKSSVLTNIQDWGFGRSELCQNRALHTYCANVPQFLRAFGFPLWLAGLALLLASQNELRRDRQRIALCLFAYMLGWFIWTMLMPSLQLFDFNWLLLWIRSRFFEGAYYALAGASLFLLAKAAPRVFWTCLASYVVYGLWRGEDQFVLRQLYINTLYLWHSWFGV